MAAMVRSSGLFDADWYRRRYPDSAPDDPILHFLVHGASDRNDPGPSFSTEAYYEANPDVAASGLNPLVHYLEHGIDEGRSLAPGRPGPPPRRRPAHAGTAWRSMLGAMTRAVTRPRARYLAQADAGEGARATLRLVSGPAPTRWCLIAWDPVVDGTRLRLQVRQGAASSELGLPPSSRARPVLVRLPDVASQLCLRQDGVGDEGGTAFPPVEIGIRSIGRPEALLRILAARLRQPRELGRALVGWDLPRWLRAQALSHTPQEVVGYQAWVRAYDSPSAAQASAMRVRARLLADPPRFSVVVPAYNTAPGPLREMIASVRGQLYPHWELCIADDASSKPHVRAILQQAAADDRRVKLALRERNGNISAASNSALALAGGQFAALLDHDDVIPPHALLVMAEAIEANRDVDLLYSDEDKIDQNGERYDPYFKPDYSPELLQSQNFISHLGVYRLAEVRRLGGFREGFEGSQDYDLALRMTARAHARVVHVPHVLYHWRLYPGAATFSSTQLARATRAARQAITESERARGETVRVVDGVGHYHRVLRPPPATWPLVSVIVPTRDHVDVLRDCIDGLHDQTDYPALDVMVVDNNSVEPDTLAYFEALERRGVRLLLYPGAFNYSAINNFAARQARGELLLLLNSDVSMLDSGWLKEMVLQMRGPRVGAVGARLLYPDLTIQHAGVVLGLGGAAGHVHVGAGREDPGYFGQLMIPREVSAVTAACALIRRDCFAEIGGLDERNLPVAFNDVDFCLRLREAGWRVIWTPYAELVHHESKSRGSDFTPERVDKFHAEVAHMRDRWGAALQHDPFFNPNLSLEHAFPTPCFPPRVARPWAVPPRSRVVANAVETVAMI